MARHRRRYFVAIPNGLGPRRLLHLKWKPTPDLYSHSFSTVIGPFRTREAAELSLHTFGEAGLNLPVRALERVARLHNADHLRAA